MSFKNLLLVALAALVVFLSAAVKTKAACSAEAFNGMYEAEVVEVIDGDTIRVLVPVWPHVIISTDVRVRGVDTPEPNSKCPAEKELAARATELTTKLVGDAVALINVTDDKFSGRVVATVFIKGNGDLAGELIKAGVGRPYDGGKRSSWCDGDP